MALMPLRWIKRIFIAVATACAVYLAYFTTNMLHMPAATGHEYSIAPQQDIDAAAPLVSLVDVPPPGMGRDIFSPSTHDSTDAFDITADGQLPAYLKVVGIVLGSPSQVIIEDTQRKETYFINEGGSQTGMTVRRIARDQVVVSFQGQDIAVPINQFVQPVDAANAPDV